MSFHRPLSPLGEVSSFLAGGGSSSGQSMAPTSSPRPGASSTDPVKVLVTLLAMEHEALEAYHYVIPRLENRPDQAMLRGCVADHQRHSVDLADAIASLGGLVPTKAELRPVVAEGPGALQRLAGDHALLQALLLNEQQICAAIGRAAPRTDLPEAIQFLLADILRDEHRHRIALARRVARAADLQAAR
jgi:hypothetical protein